MDDRKDYSKIRLTASKAIRLKCLDCCGGSIAEIRECMIIKCPMWRYKSGKEQRDELYRLAHASREKRVPDDDFQQGRAL
jgi:hypothetical protein